MAPLTEFHKFPMLPLKFREKIWQAAANIPRNVEICLRKDAYGNLVFFSPSAVAVLQVCKESRAEALLIYTSLRLNLDRMSYKIYFNKVNDTLVPAISSDNSHIAMFLSGLGRGICQKIESVAIPPLFMERMYLDQWLRTGRQTHRSDLLMSVLPRVSALSHLKEIKIITNSFEPFRHGSIDHAEYEEIRQEQWEERFSVPLTFDNDARYPSGRIMLLYHGDDEQLPVKKFYPERTLPKIEVVRHITRG